MTDAIKHIDLDSDELADAPKALRDYAKSLKKQLETVTTERDGALKQVVSRAISDVLGDKGFKNPKRVERDLLDDGIDATDKAAVEAWLADNGDDYARAVANPDPPADPELQSAEQQANAQTHQQIAAAAGERSPGGQTPYERAQSKITPDMTGAQVAAIFKEFGV